MPKIIKSHYKANTKARARRGIIHRLYLKKEVEHLKE